MAKRTQEEAYKDLIEPMMFEIQRICNENRIPFFAAFGTYQSPQGIYEKGKGLKLHCVLPQVMEIRTNDTHFSEFTNIVNGAHTFYSEAEKVLELYDAEDDALEI